MQKAASNKEILKLAIPNILSNITIPFVGMVDTALMGHEVEGAALIIAVGLAAIVFNGIYWNLGFLRVGTTGLTAQAYGQKNDKEQALILFRSLSVAIIFAIFILLLKIPIREFVFKLIATDENRKSIGYALQYFDIRILAAPAVMAIFSLRGWFYGVQNAIFPMILLTILNLINIGASLYFVKVMGWGVEGVAWGTVLAQYVALAIAVGMILFKYQKIFKYIKLKSILASKELKRFLNVNSNLLGRNILLWSVFSFFTWYASTVDEIYGAVTIVLLELFYLMSYAVDGFAYAAESIVGKYVGARDFDKLRQAIKKLMMWGVGFGLLYALVYIIFGEALLRIYTNKVEVIAEAKTFILWLSLIAVVGSIAFIWDGVYGGATLVTEMLISMAIATASFFLLFFLLKKPLGGHAIWVAMVAYMGVRGIGQWLLFDRFAAKI